MAIRYKNRRNNSFRIKIAQSKLPSTKAPRWFSAYLNRPSEAMIIPAKLSKVTKVKNFRYVLNQSTKMIHRRFVVDSLGGAAFVGFSPSGPGHDRDSTGTFADGVMPSCTIGDIGN